ncbi:hypothetical protein HRbin24_01679 [bacterium HR24]|nr:hypothetical protein HRbin24_01679 [bacterium HR24]
MWEWFLLALLGAVVGAIGTFIGAGGGFVLVPALLLLYPREGADYITGVSLAVVLANGTSGTLAYMRMRRVDYQAAILFSLATIPGAVLGSLTVGHVPRRAFEAVFGALLALMSIVLLVRAQGRPYAARAPEPAPADPPRPPYQLPAGMALSLGVGYVATLLGIGGGTIHVPAMVEVLHFPVHTATATSHFILMVNALVAVLSHIATGTYSHGVGRIVALCLGAVGGAQAGAWLSNRVRARWIVRVLALALLSVGLRTLVTALT